MNEARNRDAFKMATDLEKRIIRQVCKMKLFYRDSSNITVFWTSPVSKSTFVHLELVWKHKDQTFFMFSTEKWLGTSNCNFFDVELSDLELAEVLKCKKINGRGTFSSWKNRKSFNFCRLLSLNMFSFISYVRANPCYLRICNPCCWRAPGMQLIVRIEWD